MGKVLDYRKALSSTGQYQRNVSQGKMWVEHTEVVLDEVNDYPCLDIQEMGRTKRQWVRSKR